MMGFFWPTDVREDVGAIGRLGRVLHWCAILLGGLFAWAFIAGSAPEYWWPAAALFALFAMGGRGLRYVLAGE